MAKVKSTVASEVLIRILGVIICIEDYFNALVIGGDIDSGHGLIQGIPIETVLHIVSGSASVKLHAHFVSQLPYALIAASIAALSYIAYGLADMILLSYGVIAPGLEAYVKLVQSP